MFDAKEDKKKLIEFAKLVLDKRERRINRVMGFFKSLLIMFCWLIFTFGLFMFLAISVLQKQYTTIICKGQNDEQLEYHLTTKEALLNGCYSSYAECKEKLSNCETENTNLTRNYTNYCLREIFEPTCKQIMVE